MGEPTKILIIRFSSIGDIVLTTPVIRCLRERFPNAEIHYVTKAAYVSLIKANPYLDQVHLLGDSLKPLIHQLKRESFDLIVDLHKNLRSLRLRIALNRRTISFDKLNFSKWKLVNFKKTRDSEGRLNMPDIHIVDRYLANLESIGVRNDHKGLDYFIGGEDEVDLVEKFEIEGRFAAVCIGGKFNTKQMPADRLTLICAKINLPLVLIGGKEDWVNAEEISSDKGKKMLNACGELSISQSASVIKQAQVVLTHDTGMMHIAAAFDKPIVSIWGNTVPELGMYPYLCDRSVVIENRDLDCRPCSKIGFSNCPKGHFKCMNELDPDEIAAAVNSLSADSL